MAPKTIDLTGQRFGKLTVFGQDKTYTGKGSRWICDCDCGTKGVLVRRSNLVRGKTKSCGCYKKEYLDSVFQDLTGQKFGKLTVRELYARKGKTYWVCDCDCGTRGVIASSSDLKTGDKASCGCVRRKYIESKDLTGQKFGRLTVVRKSDRRSENGDVYYVCNCDCGTQNIEVVRSSLIATDSHRQVSCGCWVKEGFSSYNRHENRDEAIYRYLYGKLKVRNKKLGFGDNIISFEKYIELINQPCEYCGLVGTDTTKESLYYSAQKGKKTSPQIDLNYEIHHNGIDRINSELGYIQGNVVSCCKYCNMAKSNYSQEDFLFWAERVYCFFVDKHE